VFTIEDYKPIRTSDISFRKKVQIELWKFVQNTIFSYSPRRCIQFRRLLLIAFGAKLTKTVSINNTVKIRCPWNLEMDDYASLGEYCWIDNLEKVKIGKYSCISQYVFILTGSHDINSNTFSLILKPVTIGNGVWIATKAMILPGIVIDDFSVVGAGSVVVKNIEPFAVVGGNPAKYIKVRFIKEK
jgi:putative colanic acid biosynthesis acetyltransferase WcaF